MTKYTTPHHNCYFFMSPGDSCGRHAPAQIRTGVGGLQCPWHGRSTAAFRTKKRVVHTTSDHFWHTTRTTICNLDHILALVDSSWAAATEALTTY
jgi:hypothetical protein